MDFCGGYGLIKGHMGATVILLSFRVGIIVDRRFEVGAEAVCAMPQAFTNLGV